MTLFDKFKIIFLTFIFCLNVFSQNYETLPEELCHSFYSRKNKKNSWIPLRKQIPLIFRLKFAQEKIINFKVIKEQNKIQFFDEMSNKVSRSSYDQFANIYLLGQSEKYLQSWSFYQKMIEQYQDNDEKLKSLQKNIRAKVELTSDLKGCIDLLKNNLTELSDVYEKFQSQQKNIQIKMEHDNFTLANILKSDLGSGYKNIYENVTLAHLVKNLRKQAENTAVLVLHADSDGKLYDSNWDFIPHNFFHSISSQIKNLVIFSCHIKAVLKRYRLDELSKKDIDIYYPEIERRDEWIFKENIPGNFFKYFINHVFENINIDENLSNKQKNIDVCSLNLNVPGHLSGDLGVFINNTYIGKINKKERLLSFDCRFIAFNNENIITIQNINLFDTPNVDENNLSFKKSFSIDHLKNIREIQVKSTFYKGKYLGSKSIF